MSEVLDEVEKEVRISKRKKFTWNVLLLIMSLILYMNPYTQDIFYRKTRINIEYYQVTFMLVFGVLFLFINQFRKLQRFRRKYSLYLLTFYLSLSFSITPIVFLANYYITVKSELELIQAESDWAVFFDDDRHCYFNFTFGRYSDLGKALKNKCDCEKDIYLKVRTGIFGFECHRSEFQNKH